MVQATAKSATSRFMIAVLCLCSFSDLVAELFRPQRNRGP